MHARRVVAFDEVRRVAVAPEQFGQVLLGNARQHGRAGNLIAVQVQDRQHRAVAHRIKKFVALPATAQRAGLRFAIPHDARHEHVRIVERRSIGVQQRIAQLAPFIDRARQVRAGVARHTAGRGKLAEQNAYPGFVLRNVGMHFAVRPLQVRAGIQRRSAVPGPGDIDGVQLVFVDQPVDVHVDETEPGRGAPVSQQPRLDVLHLQRIAQQRVLAQINLSNRQVVSGAPVAVHFVEQLGRERLFRGIRRFAGQFRLSLGLGHHESSLCASRRYECLAIIKSSSVLITRTVTELLSVEITSLPPAFRAGSRQMPKKSRPVQICSRT